jgi:hypothetical protein
MNHSEKILLVVCVLCFTFCGAYCYAENKDSKSKKDELLKEIMMENHSSYYRDKDLDSKKAHFLNEIKNEMGRTYSSSKSVGATSSAPSVLAMQSVEHKQKTSSVKTSIPQIEKQKDSSTKITLVSKKNKLSSEKTNKKPEKRMEKKLEKAKDETLIEAPRKAAPIVGKESASPTTPPSKNEPKAELNNKRQREISKEKIHKIRRDFRKEIEGLYVGGGITSSVTNASAVNRNVGFEGNSRSNTMTDIHASLGAASGVSNIEIQSNANAGTYPHHFKASGNVNSDFVKGRSSKIGLSVAGGFGEFVHGDVYAGVDACLDFTKSQTDVSEKFTTRIAYKSHVKQSSITPTVAARIGVYSDILDSMIYGRLGCALIKADAEIEGLGKVKMTSVTPVVGVGLQKKFDHFSVRLEGDYRFLTHRDVELSRGTIAADQFDDNISGVTVTNGIRLKSHGYAARLMSMLHI